MDNIEKKDLKPSNTLYQSIYKIICNNSAATKYEKLFKLF